jgi:hypothetical protein
MAEDLLVDMRRDGQRLVDQLVSDGFEVSVAFWVRTSDESSWSLYIASPSVDSERLGVAYRQVFASLNNLTRSSVSPSDIKLVNESNPIARNAIDVRKDIPDEEPISYGGKRLDGLQIKEAIIYPMPWPRVSYSVKYFRSGNTNNWMTTTERGEVLKGVRARGAVGYSTGSWEGENSADTRFAIVWVLLAVNPALASPAIVNRSDVRRMMSDQARMAADQVFLVKHPAAAIEHDVHDD